MGKYYSPVSSEVNSSTRLSALAVWPIFDHAARLSRTFAASRNSSEMASSHFGLYFGLHGLYLSMFRA